MRLSKAKKIETLRRVARHMRRYPQLYNFMRGGVHKKGTPACEACMLARAAMLLGMEPGTRLGEVARDLGFSERGGEDGFYNDVQNALHARGLPIYLDTADNFLRLVPQTTANIALAIEDVAASL